MIKENLLKIKQKLPSNVELIAVSKTKPPVMIMEAYNHGHKDFGENKVQELISKHPLLPADIRWHMIGHLQSRKARQALELADLIHSVDSAKLATRLARMAEEDGRVVHVLAQVNTSGEAAKSGFELARAVDDLLAARPARDSSAGWESRDSPQAPS